MPKKRVRLKSTNGTEGMLKVIWGFVALITGMLVSLAVGFGMVSGSLRVPLIPEIVTTTAGWVVVILTILGAALALIDKIAK